MIPGAAGRPGKKKPFNQIEPGGEGGRDACDLHAQAHRRRSDPGDVAEEIRDVRPGEKRADDPGGQRGGKQKP